MMSAWVGVSQNYPGDELFKLRKSMFCVRQFFSNLALSKYLTFFYLITYLFLQLKYRTSIKNIHQKNAGVNLYVEEQHLTLLKINPQCILNKILHPPFPPKCII